MFKIDKKPPEGERERERERLEFGVTGVQKDPCFANNKLRISQQQFSRVMAHEYLN